MRTTPATRAFTDAELPDDVLYEILDAARFAPTAAIVRPGEVVIVRDPAAKQEIARLYELGMREYVGYVRAGLVPFVASDAHRRDEPAIDLEAARQVPPDMDTSYLAQAPVLLVILLDLTNCAAVDSGLDRLPSVLGRRSIPSPTTSCWRPAAGGSEDTSPRCWPGRSTPCASFSTFRTTWRWRPCSPSASPETRSPGCAANRSRSSPGWKPSTGPPSGVRSPASADPLLAGPRPRWMRAGAGAIP